MNENVRCAFTAILQLTFRQLWIVTLSLLLTVAGRGEASQLSEKPLLDTAQIQVGLSDNQSEPFVKIDVETQQLESSKRSVETIASRVSSETLKKHSTVVFSTDDPMLMQESLQQKDLSLDNLHLVPIPKESANEISTIGAGAQGGANFSKLIKKYAASAVNSVKNDKIGFLILTYTTATESLTWIHSTHMTQFEKTSSVIYTVGLALVFGLNKDSWSHATRPLQAFFRKILNSDIHQPASSREFLTRFLGNVSLAGVVTGFRIPMMSIDHIIQSGLQLHYFTMPLLMTVVSTAAIFTWSENLAMIDEREMPLSKFVFRRASEIRSIVIGTFATAAALLNPSQYGETPWIVMAAVGTAGAVIYFNAAKIHQWIESQPWLEKVKLVALSRNQVRDAQSMQCQMLFN